MQKNKLVLIIIITLFSCIKLRCMDGCKTIEGFLPYEKKPLTGSISFLNKGKSLLLCQVLPEQQLPSVSVSIVSHLTKNHNSLNGFFVHYIDLSDTYYTFSKHNGSDSFINIHKFTNNICTDNIFDYTTNEPTRVKFLCNKNLLAASSTSFKIFTLLPFDTYVTNYIEKPFLTSQEEIPLITTHPTQYSYTYHDKNLNEIVVTDMSNKKNIFILFTLIQQNWLPRELLKKIMSKIHALPWTYRIKVENNAIKDMVYSPNGKHFALVYDDQINLYNNDDIEHNQSHYITLPYSGFMTFHPNSTIAFILTPDATLYAIHLPTNKEIFKQHFKERTASIPADDIPSYGDYYKRVTINPMGDKCAIAFDDACELFTISPELQNILNTIQK